MAEARAPRSEGAGEPGIQGWADGCAIAVLDRGSRICIDVHHLGSGAEVSVIGPAERREEMQRRALARIAAHLGAA